jgi:FkbM family methyltransferase
MVRGIGTMIRTWLTRLRDRLSYRWGRELFTPGYLKSLGFNVNTIIDVGVDWGTRPLYEAFSGCQFVLVDPRRDAEAKLSYKPTRYVFVNQGLAANAGHLTLRGQSQGKTSFLERTALTAAPVNDQYDVNVTTFDAFIESVEECQPPAGIKIDTEGYELEIMKGLTRYWGIVQFVICEASVRRRFVQSYQMSELVS